jgi:hypothetical protein
MSRKLKRYIEEQPQLPTGFRCKVDLIQERIEKATKKPRNIVIYLWSGTCDITVKVGKFIKLRHQNNKTIDLIVNHYRRAISIVAILTATEE